MNPMEQPAEEIEPESRIEVDPTMFEGATDGDKVSVQVEGTLKIKEDGSACIYPETVDGEPVASAVDQDPAEEGMKQMKAAGYGQGKGIEIE